MSGDQTAWREIEDLIGPIDMTQTPNTWPNRGAPELDHPSKREAQGQTNLDPAVLHGCPSRGTPIVPIPLAFQRNPNLRFIVVRRSSCRRLLTCPSSLDPSAYIDVSPDYLRSRWRLCSLAAHPARFRIASPRNPLSFPPNYDIPSLPIRSLRATPQRGQWVSPCSRTGSRWGRWFRGRRRGLAPSPPNRSSSPLTGRSVWS